MYASPENRTKEHILPKNYKQGKYKTDTVMSEREDVKFIDGQVRLVRYQTDNSHLYDEQTVTD